MSLFEILVSVQTVVMLLAGLFAYITGRDNKSRERELDDLRDELSRIEAKVDKLIWERSGRLGT